MISIAHFLIWFYRPRERSHIYLALTGFLIILHFFIRQIFGSGTPENMFALISLYKTGTKPDYLFIAIGWILYTAFLDSFFPLFVQKTASHFFQYTGIIAGILVLVCGAYTYSVFYFFFQGIILLLTGYSFFVIIISIRNHGREGILMLAGFILLCLSMIYDILVSDFPVHGISMIYTGLSVFLVIPVIIRHLEWGQALNRAGHLSENLEREVAEKTAELEKVAEEAAIDCMKKTAFFINFAHEIKTPLTLIRNSLEEYLKRNKPFPELKTLGFYTGKLFRDILNLMDAEKIGQGVTLYNHNVASNVSVILPRIIGMFTPLARRKKIRLLFSGEDAVYAAVDPDAFDRIISNILDNAIKYTDEKGCIKVFLKPEQERVCVTVKDNGKGIPRDRLEKIFLPYYTIPGGRSRARGFGIGLSLVKQIVDSCKGEIRIRSKIGKGTRITIFFQGISVSKEGFLNSGLKRSGIASIDDFTPAQLLTGDSGIDLLPEVYDKRKYTVFIVDDHIDLIGYLQKNMAGYFNVFYATCGESAMEKLNAIPKPDIIISDIMMETMDGHEFYNLCMADRNLGDIPFIFLTARTTRCEKLDSLKKGIIDYIFKPFDVEELIEKIISLVKYKRKSADLQIRKMENRISEWLHVHQDNEFIDFEKRCKQFKISRREKEVIQELLKGYETKEIADKLSLSIHTVRNHIRHIYHKCKVQNRVELVNLFSKA